MTMTITIKKLYIQNITINVLPLFYFFLKRNKNQGMHILEPNYVTVGDDIYIFDIIIRAGKAPDGTEIWNRFYRRLTLDKKEEELEVKPLPKGWIRINTHRDEFSTYFPTAPFKTHLDPCVKNKHVQWVRYTLPSILTLPPVPGMDESTDNTDNGITRDTNDITNNGLERMKRNREAALAKIAKNKNKNKKTEQQIMVIKVNSSVGWEPTVQPEELEIERVLDTEAMGHLDLTNANTDTDTDPDSGTGSGYTPSSTNTKFHDCHCETITDAMNDKIAECVTKQVKQVINNKLELLSERSKMDHLHLETRILEHLDKKLMEMVKLDQNQNQNQNQNQGLNNNYQNQYPSSQGSNDSSPRYYNQRRRDFQRNRDRDRDDGPSYQHLRQTVEKFEMDKLVSQIKEQVRSETAAIPVAIPAPAPVPTPLTTTTPAPAQPDPIQLILLQQQQQIQALANQAKPKTPSKIKQKKTLLSPNKKARFTKQQLLTQLIRNTHDDDDDDDDDVLIEQYTD